MLLTGRRGEGRTSFKRPKSSSSLGANTNLHRERTTEDLWPRDDTVYKHSGVDALLLATVLVLAARKANEDRTLPKETKVTPPRVENVQLARSNPRSEG